MKTGSGNMKQSVRAERYAREVEELDAKPGLTMKEREKRATLLHCLARYTEAYREIEHLATTDPYNALQSTRQYVVYLMWHGDYDKVVEYLTWLRNEHPRTFWMVSGSFASDSGFWHGSDPNLRLLTQTLLRDVVSPRLGMPPAHMQERRGPR